MVQSKSKSVITLLREESPLAKRNGLAQKLSNISLFLWEEKPQYQTRISGKEREERIPLLVDGTFQFSPMHRSRIPNP